MLKFFLFSITVFITVIVCNAEDEKYVGDYTYHEYQHAFGSSSGSSSTSDDFSSSSSSSSSYYPSYSNYYGYQYPYQAPIYGNTGYTTGQINNVQAVNTGQTNDNYYGYSSNYWTCVNNYRGQYYYSYTYGHYICDTRTNRYGK